MTVKANINQLIPFSIRPCCSAREITFPFSRLARTLSGMDFIIDSDSDSTTYSPQAKHRSTIGRAEYGLQQTLKAREEERLGRRTTSGYSKADLMEAYERLETPKAFSRTVNRRPDDVVSGFEVSRERMRLANIIDSETNDDTDSFLLPITMQSWV